MKKIALVIAALTTIAIAAPSIASAETIVVKHGHHDMHPHHHVVVIHRGHRH
jgi:hypothetical protein